MFLCLQARSRNFCFYYMDFLGGMHLNIKIMRKTLFLILLLSTTAAFSQESSVDWIKVWQRVTFSIGNVKYDTSMVGGERKLTPYYNILGSGIFCYVSDSVPVICVTAKHVLQGENGKFLDSFQVRFSWEDDRSVYAFLGHKVVLKQSGDKKNIIFTHPEKTFDLACFPFTSIDREIGKNIRILSYGNFATSEDYREGLNIFTLGYPGSVGKNYWTRALVRKGIISWVPQKDISTQKFLIDADVYPGNSGGPVISEVPLILSGDTTKSAEIKYRKFYGLLIERRFGLNKLLFAKNHSTDSINKFSSTAQDLLLSRESIRVGVVEPAENIRSLLEALQKSSLYKISK